MAYVARHLIISDQEGKSISSDIKLLLWLKGILCDSSYKELSSSQQRQALQYASNNMKNDRDIVFAAVTNDGHALQHASEYLRNDKDIVLAAVTSTGNALSYASDDIKNNYDIVSVAVLNNPNALQYASVNIQNNALL